MNIVVLGAGTVGTSIADRLCRLDHSVTVVDLDPEMVRVINESLDVRAIVGSASQSSVLFQAGIGTADICLAVTGKDEVNIVAASMAKAMGVRRSIARVYSPVFRDLSTFDYQRHFGIDRMLSLEHLTAIELARGIRDPGSVVVEQFARGGLEVQELIVGQEGAATAKPIRDLGLPSNVRIGMIQRERRFWIAAADDQFKVGDKVTVFSRPEDVKSVRSLFKSGSSSAKRVVIAGGGETGLQLARTLERESCKVMVIESDEARCQILASLLEHSTVVHGDARRRENLEEQRVGNADVFVACTGDDEDNMMLGVEADDLGAKQIMTVIDRPDYASVIEKLGIDLAVSEREVMARQVAAYLNDGIIISRTKMPGGLINVLEIDVVDGSPATESTLADLGLPDRCLIVAVIQQDYVRVPGASDRLSAGDTAVVLVEEDVIETALAVFTPVRGR
jgi:trk system potassium uptake protein TrkA